MKILENLIEQIEEMCVTLLELNTEKFNESYNSVIKKCITYFPVIISKYADPRLSDVSEDAVYWPAQLERMIECGSKNDTILIFDVFYNETRENLIEFLKLLDDRDISF